MSSAVSTQGCCSPNPCDSPQITPVPGPAGSNGSNAFTTSTASFTMPAVNSTVQINVSDTSFMVLGQTIYVQTAGYMGVSSIQNATTVTLTNIGAAGNAASGTTIPTARGVTPAGVQGPTGSLNSLSPTTTKGDLIVDNGTGSGAARDVRFPVSGTNGNILHEDSSQTLGLVYRAFDLTGINSKVTGQLPIAQGGTGQTTAATALNALMPGGAVAGNIVYFNGTNWTALVIGTVAHSVLRTNTAKTAPEWALQGVIQSVLKLFVASSGLNTTSGVAFGSTAPTTGSGVVAFTQAVTPLSAASKLKVHADIVITTAAGAYIALFNGNTLLAVRATSLVGTQVIAIDHEFAPGAVTPLTLNVYIGNNGSTNEVYIGGTAANQNNFYGTATNVGTLLIEEII